MNVILVEPSFPRNQREFARGLAAAGARVLGVGEAPAAALDEELRGWLADYVQVRSVVDEPELERAVRSLQDRCWIDRLEATVEAHVLPAARVRERCSIPGTSVRTAFLCRDKPAMKQALREAGIPCAQLTGATSPEEVRAFAERAGYPLILKPRDAAGAAGTVRVDGPEELERALRAAGVDRGAPVAVEEFNEGHEGFYDTITIGGEPVHEFVSHYYPNVLEAMRARWISPQIVTTNRIDAAGYDEVKAMGRRVIEVLGIETSATHMEWFFGPKGLRFSEIGCRPPGVGMWDLYAAANEFDIYREWAVAVLHGRADQRPSRRYAAGLVNLRPDRDGRIERYENLDEALAAVSEWIVDHQLPPPGTPTQPVDAGYMANAWIRLRHPDYDELRRLLGRIGEKVRVRAS